MGILDMLNPGRAKETLENIREVNAEHQKLQAAVENADGVFAEFERIRDGVPQTPEACIAEMRMPEKLFTRISDRLVESGLTPKKWRDEPSMIREKMLEEAFFIALEEMQVSEEIRSQVRVLQSDLSKEETEAIDTIRGGALFHSMVGDAEDAKIFGDSRRFVRAEMGDLTFDDPADVDMSKPYGGRYTLEMNGPVLVTMPDGIMYEKDLEKALAPMICQALMVMEQASLLEPEGTIADTIYQDMWLEEIVDGSGMGIDRTQGNVFESARELVSEFVCTYKDVYKAKK